VGFAVPSNMVARVVPALISRGHYEHPWLGIAGQDIDNLLAESLDLPVQRGVLVEITFRDGPASQADLRGGSREVEVEGTFEIVRVGGDIIIGIDDQPVNGMDDLITYLETRQVGDEVVVTVLRDGDEQMIPITLEERPTQ